MRAVLCFVAAIAISAAIQSQLTGCLLPLGDDCNCPPRPERPERQVALLIDGATAFSAAGNGDVLPVDPHGGTVEVTGDELIVRYEKNGMQREIVYAVEPAR